MSNVPPRPAQVRDDDWRAARAQAWRSYHADRRWRLASLALYLVCFALTLVVNIIWTEAWGAVRRLARLVST